MVKIDGAFVKNLADDTSDQIFVKTMIELANSFGMETVAEWVGDDRTARFLQNLWQSKGFAGVPLFIGLMCLTVYSLILWLVLRGYRNSVKNFTAEGLTRNDGRSFAWTNLNAVVDKIRTTPRGRFVWRIEVRFNNGDAAWLIPMKVNNFAEVRAYVNNLPCPHTEEKA